MLSDKPGVGPLFGRQKKVKGFTREIYITIFSYINNCISETKHKLQCNY